MPNKKISKILGIVGALLIAQLAGGIGAIFTTPQTGVGSWYAALNKSSLNPPGWVFGPVWTILFLLMGYASYLVWEKRKSVPVVWPLIIYFFQLALNILWSILFFGLHNPGASLVEIYFLEAAIIACAILFYRVSKPAAYLLLPYILWVGFASYLNYSVWALNLPKACTLEAKICADGSAVGRVGPNCEFSSCPAAVPGTENWKTLKDTTNKVEFKYPETLNANYITLAVWPPKVTLTTGTFSCVESVGTPQTPQTVLEHLWSGHDFCVSQMSEGAAGSVFTEYTYITPLRANLAKINFTLQYPQCDNYDDPNKSDCKKERQTFDLDGLVEKIFETVK